MFTVIYRWRLHPGLEQDFVANWRSITKLGLAAGSGGSSLFKDGVGGWTAIARWPSRQARQQFFDQLDRDAAASEIKAAMQRAIAERFSPHELESVLDMWAPLDGGAL